MKRFLILFLLVSYNAYATTQYALYPSVMTGIGGTVAGGTSGSVLYVDSSKNLGQDNSNFFWDATNHRIGIGTTVPPQALSVSGVAEILGSSASLIIDGFNSGSSTTYKVTIASDQTAMTQNYTMILPDNAPTANQVWLPNTGTWGGPYLSQGSLTNALQLVSAKDFVDAVCNSNQTISGAVVCDGVTASPGFEFLFAAQSTSSQNGLYTYDGITWTRDTYFRPDSSLGYPSLIAASQEGATLGNSIWMANSSAFGSDNTYVQVIAPGGTSVKVVSSANYAITSTDGFGEVDVTTGASQRTITLPPPGLNKNRRLTVKKIDSGAGSVKVAQNASEKIDADTNYVINNQWGSISVYSDGTNWFIADIVMADTVKCTTLRSAASGLTTTTTANVCGSITVPGGDWEIIGAVGFNPGATTSITRLDYAVSATSATLPASDTTMVPSSTGEVRGIYDTAANVAGGDLTFTLPPARITVANGSSQTLYLVAQGTFSVSTLAPYGQLIALRRR